MFLSKLNMSRIEESISKLKRFKYHAIGRLELEDAIDNVVSWYEQMMKEAVEGWVAADSDTEGKRRVTLFPKKPVRDVLTEYKYWAATHPRYESIKLDSNAFPNLKWEDEPKKVRIIIVKED